MPASLVLGVVTLWLAQAAAQAENCNKLFWIPTGCGIHEKTRVPSAPAESVARTQVRDAQWRLVKEINDFGLLVCDTAVQYCSIWFRSECSSLAREGERERGPPRRRVESTMLS